MAKLVKGEDRNRPGKWIVDYREAGTRKWKTFDTQGEAKDFLKKVFLSDSPAYCGVDPNVTLAEYGDSVIAGREGIVKRRTVSANTHGFLRVKRYLGGIKVKDLTPGVIIRFLESCKREGLANGTIRYHLEVLTLVLNRARIDGVIAGNPAFGVGKQVRLEKSQATGEIKAFTLEQRAAFIEAAKSSRWYVLYRFLLATGVRLGEALALRIDDLSGLTAVIDETFSHGYLDSTKSNRSRTVDLTPEIAGLLKQQVARTIAAELEQGRQAQFVWPNPEGNPWKQSWVAKDFSRIVKLAGLPAHFTPHCTRHTYATLLLSNGESIQYVQQQLGHASITLTVDTYGKWLPLKSSGVLERIESNVAKRNA